MSILIIAEHKETKLRSSTLCAITAAKQLSEQNIDLLIIGYKCDGAIKEASQIIGLNKVLYTNHITYKGIVSENIARLVARTGRNYDYIIAPSNSSSCDFMPRTSALLDTQMISEVISIKNDNTFARPIYSGSALETIETQEQVKIFTIRASNFTPYDRIDSNHEAYLVPIPPEKDLGLSKIISRTKEFTSRPDISNASIVVSGGRGLQTKENFEALIIDLADKLGAAIGGTKNAVDTGFISKENQVGLTGHSISPDLYIAIGISGAIQHTERIKDSKVIVAINNDPNAPIFNVSDYYLVTDLFEAVPKLIEIM